MLETVIEYEEKTDQYQHRGRQQGRREHFAGHLIDLRHGHQHQSATKPQRETLKSMVKSAWAIPRGEHIFLALKIQDADVSDLIRNASVMLKILAITTFTVYHPNGG